MRYRYRLLCCAVLPALVVAKPSMAAEGDHVENSDGVTVEPILDLRLRYETVDQDNPLDTADALTIRGRAGFEVAKDGLSFLAEAEGTLAIVDDYNDTIPSNGIEPYSVVADPDNFELNRLQVAYTKDGNSVTLGRQRINHDGQRFIGAVAWRQNEQTFDAVRGQAKIGPVSLDAAYSISQRTIFGNDSPNQDFEGELILLNGGGKVGDITLKAFSYLLDYDTRIAFSSQSYGVLATGSVPLGKAKLLVTASIAEQKDYGANPTDFSAQYLNLELGTAISGFTLKAGYEELGSDDGVASFQTPLATLHKFNGFADVFLVTPANGLRDYYVSAKKQFTIGKLPKFTAGVTYHKFESDVGGLDYGDEWDATLGFKLGKVGILAKYANYSSDGFAVDTEKFWLQAGISF